MDKEQFIEAAVQFAHQYHYDMEKIREFMHSHFPPSPGGARPEDEISAIESMYNAMGIKSKTLERTKEAFGMSAPASAAPSIGEGEFAEYLSNAGWLWSPPNKVWAYNGDPLKCKTTAELYTLFLNSKTNA